MGNSDQAYGGIRVPIKSINTLYWDQANCGVILDMDCEEGNSNCIATSKDSKQTIPKYKYEITSAERGEKIDVWTCPETTSDVISTDQIKLVFDNVKDKDKFIKSLVHEDEKLTRRRDKFKNKF